MGEELRTWPFLSSTDAFLFIGFSVSIGTFNYNANTSI